MFLVAWWSGEHHADRAKRIIENNRVERQKKWRKLNREIAALARENKNLKELIRRIK